MVRVHTLASGSSGNALLFQWDGGLLLLDAGISCRRIAAALRGLGASPEDLDAVLITHCHSDHIAGLKTLLKHTDAPLVASGRCCRELDRRFPGIRDRLRPIAGTMELDGCVVSAFPTAHDSPGSCGFRLDADGGSFGVLTDTGSVTEEARAVLSGAGAVLLEADYDRDLLRRGPYPWRLKDRVSGPLGHLSNDDAADFAVGLARSGTQEIVLAHLSAQNDTPALALDTVRAALDHAGLSPALSVAPRDRTAPVRVPGTARAGPPVVRPRTGTAHAPVPAGGPAMSPCGDGGPLWTCPSLSKD